MDWKDELFGKCVGANTQQNHKFIGTKTLLTHYGWFKMQRQNRQTKEEKLLLKYEEQVGCIR